ncbi:hypothetical protein DFJ73DRAFT_924423 [Zopfochytrium polystomum]|nr:hypothetical protein DFJ73DRAFT_924423 [Zopfochytrium polystomum]
MPLPPSPTASPAASPYALPTPVPADSSRTTGSDSHQPATPASRYPTLPQTSISTATTAGRSRRRSIGLIAVAPSASPRTQMRCGAERFWRSSVNGSCRNCEQQQQLDQQQDPRQDPQQQRSSSSRRSSDVAAASPPGKHAKFKSAVKKFVNPQGVSATFAIANNLANKAIKGAMTVGAMTPIEATLASCAVGLVCGGAKEGINAFIEKKPKREALVKVVHGAITQAGANVANLYGGSAAAGVVSAAGSLTQSHAVDAFGGKKTSTGDKAGNAMKAGWQLIAGATVGAAGTVPAEASGPVAGVSSVIGDTIKEKVKKLGNKYQKHNEALKKQQQQQQQQQQRPTALTHSPKLTAKSADAAKQATTKALTKSPRLDPKSSAAAARLATGGASAETKHKFQSAARGAGKAAVIAKDLQGKAAATRLKASMATKAETAAAKMGAAAKAGAAKDLGKAQAAAQKELERAHAGIKGGSSSAGSGSGLKFNIPDSLKPGAKHNLKFNTPPSLAPKSTASSSSASIGTPGAKMAPAKGGGGSGGGRVDYSKPPRFDKTPPSSPKRQASGNRPALDNSPSLASRRPSSSSSSSSSGAHSPPPKPVHPTNSQKAPPPTPSASKPSSAKQGTPSASGGGGGAGRGAEKPAKKGGILSRMKESVKSTGAAISSGVRKVVPGNRSKVAPAPAPGAGAGAGAGAGGGGSHADRKKATEKAAAAAVAGAGGGKGKGAAASAAKAQSSSPNKPTKGADSSVSASLLRLYGFTDLTVTAINPALRAAALRAIFSATSTSVSNGRPSTESLRFAAADPTHAAGPRKADHPLAPSRWLTVDRFIFEEALPPPLRLKPAQLRQADVHLRLAIYLKRRRRRALFTNVVLPAFPPFDLHPAAAGGAPTPSRRPASPWTSPYRDANDAVLDCGLGPTLFDEEFVLTAAEAESAADCGRPDVDERGRLPVLLGAATDETRRVAKKVGLADEDVAWAEAEVLRLGWA